MADEQPDQSDRILPWTIKGIEPEARNAAISAAKREKQTLGEWMARAIRNQIQSDRGRERAPAVVGPAVQPAANLAEVERTVALIRELSDSGAPPPKAVSRLAYGLLKSQLETLRGPTSSKKSPTKSLESQTEQESPTASQKSPTEED